MTISSGAQSGTTSAYSKAIRPFATKGRPDPASFGLAGEPVEFAHLLIEGTFGHEAVKLADEPGLRSRGVAQFGFLVGRRGDDRLGDGGGVFALLDSVGDHLLGGFAALVVDRQRVVG